MSDARISTSIPLTVEVAIRLPDAYAHCAEPVGGLEELQLDVGEELSLTYHPDDRAKLVSLLQVLATTIEEGE